METAKPYTIRREQAYTKTGLTFLPQYTYTAIDPNDHDTEAFFAWMAECSLQALVH